MLHSFLSGYLEKSANDEKEAKKSDLLQAIPFIGGGLHGLARPARGASRFESGTAQGLGGLLGGGLVGIPTAGLAGMAASEAYGRPGTDREREQKAKLVALSSLLGLLGGGAVGTAGGSALARLGTKREVMTPEDWKVLAQQMQQDQTKGKEEEAEED